jgi:dipicolinate synthase subunit B
MEELKGKTVGFGFTGSFCMYEKIFSQMKVLKEEGANLIPIFSNASQTTDCRFGKAEEFLKNAEEISGHTPIRTIPAAEPIGPKSLLDIMLIAPCTGNTLAKLANGITDTPVLMAAKAHLRNQKPLVLFLSTNDALGMNFKNIGLLFNCKNIYFVPFGQDNYKKKPTSMVAEPSLISATLKEALSGKQLQPVILSPKPDK